MKKMITEFAFRYDPYPASFRLQDSGPDTVKSLIAAYLLSNGDHPHQNRFLEKLGWYLHAIHRHGFNPAPCFDIAAVLDCFVRDRPLLGAAKKFTADLLDLLFQNFIDPAHSVQTLAFIRDLIRDKHPALGPVLPALSREIRMNRPFPACFVQRQTETPFYDCRNIRDLKRRLSERAPSAETILNDAGSDRLNDFAHAWREDAKRLFFKGLRMVAMEPQATTFCKLYSALARLAIEQAFHLAFPSGADGFLLARSMKNMGSDLDYVFIGRAPASNLSFIEQFLKTLGFYVDHHQGRTVLAELHEDRLSDYSMCYLLHMDFCAGNETSYQAFCRKLFQRLDERRAAEGLSFGEFILKKYFSNRLAAWSELDRSFFSTSPAAALSIKHSAIRAVEDLMLAFRFQTASRKTGDPVEQLRLENKNLSAEDAAVLADAYDRVLWFRNCLHYHFGYNYNELHPQSLEPSVRMFGLSVADALKSLHETARALNRIVEKYFPKCGGSVK